MEEVVEEDEITRSRLSGSVCWKRPDDLIASRRPSVSDSPSNSNDEKDTKGYYNRKAWQSRKKMFYL